VLAPRGVEKASELSPLRLIFRVDLIPWCSFERTDRVHCVTESSPSRAHRASRRTPKALLEIGVEPVTASVEGPEFPGILRGRAPARRQVHHEATRAREANFQLGKALMRSRGQDWGPSSDGAGCSGKRAGSTVHLSEGPYTSSMAVLLCCYLPRSRRVRDTTGVPGRSVRFLPPYSPDFNPIELAFAKLKAFLRAARPRSFDQVTTLIAIALELFSPSECANYIRHCGYRLARPSSCGSFIRNISSVSTGARKTL